MIRSQLQHATGKIADGDANCLYAAGLISLTNVMLNLVDNTVLADWLNVWITLIFIQYVLHTNMSFNNRKKTEIMPDYICQRKDIAVISCAWASTVSLIGQNSL